MEKELSRIADALFRYAKAEERMAKMMERQVELQERQVAASEATALSMLESKALERALAMKLQGAENGDVSREHTEGS